MCFIYISCEFPFAQGMGLEPLPKKIQFALEPLLDTMTPSERLTEGDQHAAESKFHLYFQ